MARHVDRGRSGPAPEVERPTSREATRALDDLDQLRWRDPAVPRLEPEPVGEPEKNVGGEAHVARGDMLP